MRWVTGVILAEMPAQEKQEIGSVVMPRCGTQKQ
jgi:hypothetical protein